MRRPSARAILNGRRWSSSVHVGCDASIPTDAAAEALAHGAPGGRGAAALAVVLAVAVAVAVSFAVDAFAAESHSTTGDIVAFGPKNAYVSIAHDAIPGYMGAMTMSFEPRRPAQLEGLAVGNHVAFTFTATDDGHRFLDQIRPQAK